MENLEQRCLEKLDNILSKFDLKIDVIHITSFNIWQYRLVDNKNLSGIGYYNWLGLWLSIPDMLIHHYSIFKCLEKYSKF